MNGLFGAGTLVFFLLVAAPTTVYLWSPDSERRTRALRLLRLFLRPRE